MRGMLDTSSGRTDVRPETMHRPAAGCHEGDYCGGEGEKGNVTKTDFHSSDPIQQIH